MMKRRLLRAAYQGFGSKYIHKTEATGAIKKHVTALRWRPGRCRDHDSSRLSIHAKAYSGHGIDDYDRFISMRSRLSYPGWWCGPRRNALVEICFQSCADPSRKPDAWCETIRISYRIPRFCAKATRTAAAREELKRFCIR